MRDSLTIRKGRDRLTVMAQILNIARDGILKSHIMYRANLSYARLEEYLAFLQEIRLFKAYEKDGQTLYKTTSKGIIYLENFSKIKDLLDKDVALAETRESKKVATRLERQNVMSKIIDVEARLRFLETRLSNFLEKDFPNTRYCPYCGREMERTRGENEK